MPRLSASILIIGLVATAAPAMAQSSGYYPGYGRDRYDDDRYDNRYDNRYDSGAVYDYARVIRVDPVIDRRHGSDPSSTQRCYSEPVYTDGYGNDRYDRRDGYYGNAPDTAQRSGSGSEGARTAATIVGGIAGAVLGSQVGGGSGTYAATAIGSMVGGLAGRQIYDSSHREVRTGSVRVCDPMPVRDGYGYGNYPVDDGRVSGYDVTYAYAGRSFRTRTDYHPGDRIRVRVDVRPE